MAKNKIKVEGISITIDANGFVSITDIAKKSANTRPREVIRNWLRNLSTINYLEEWEKAHNPNFKGVQFDPFRKNAGKNNFIISPKLYIEQIEPVGIISKSGRYGGTYVHSDIALNFCYWLSPKFQVYFLKEFQRLKNDEATRLGLQFDLRRELSKANYPFHTDAIKKYLVSPNTQKAALIYASEADLLNTVLFGCTAKQWKAHNPNKPGNIRDYATIEELMIMANIEFLNGKLIAWDCDQEQRAELLNETVKEQMKIYKKSSAVKRIKAKAK